MTRKSLSLLFAFALVSTAAYAQNNAKELNPDAGKYFAKGFARKSGGGGSNLVFHNGGHVLRNAHVVFIFWGPSFAIGGSDNGYATNLELFRDQFGTTPQYNVITQYYGTDDNDGSYGNISLATLGGGQGDWFDTSAPPTNVTDANVQSEVQRYTAANGTDYAAIYEVVIPPTSYSSSGTQTSCGGPNLTYCAYHGYYVDGAGRNVKYSIEPYPSCSGCTSSGWTDVQNQEHFVTHETREAVTDSILNAWYDHRGYEADDKCAWSPSPFILNGFGYQYEWSNTAGGCVQGQ